METNNAFGGDGGSVINMAGCIVGKCQCGGNFVVLNEEYVFHNDVATVTKGSIEDRELLARLLQVVRESVAAGETPEQTVERAAEFLPWLRGKLSQPVVIFAISWLTQYAGNKALDSVVDPYIKKPDITIEQIERSLRNAVEEAIRNGSLQLKQTESPKNPSVRT
ncbi:hypothetical protein [Comamonas sp. lk]|uniref:hypothetical protein n=1 Tax=Comamonas sp. lk TaxID=2201272 RepID=UPI000EABB539|nr:hypothetical protein [Comamonas sp. lk]